MNAPLEIFPTSSAINLIGWTLIHFVWQATILAIAYGIMSLFGIRSANLRYGIACCVLMLMFVCPIATLTYLQSPWQNAVAIDASATGINTSNTSSLKARLQSDAFRESENVANTMTTMQTPKNTASSSGTSVNPANWLMPAMPLIVGLWLTGVAIHLLRLLGGLWRVRQWIATARPVADSQLEQSFKLLSQRMKCRFGTRLLLTDRTNSPAVAGLLRPAILLPASLLTSLSWQELELVLAHELAHVRRNDFLINLFQKTAESLFFYHPAVWWISRQISAEREKCCDDLAVQEFGDPIALAKALTVIESNRCENQLAIAATDGALKERIQRLLLPEPTLARSGSLAGWMGALVVGIVLVTAFPFSRHIFASPVNTLPKVEIPNVIPFLNATVIGEDVEKKPEVRRKDSKTGIEQRVFTEIKLQSKRDDSSRDAMIAMKYSNVISYSFVPEKLVRQLNTTKIGEIDFEKFKDQSSPHDVTWMFIPNDFSNPTGYIKDGVPHRYLRFVRKPVPDGEVIIPNRDDKLYVPDHLGFYGMNQIDQSKFDVVRIDQVDLGIGKPFGPVNALVLSDENSDFGLLGRQWTTKVRGKRGGSLLHSALGEFQIHANRKNGSEQGRNTKRNKTDDGNSSKPGPTIPTAGAEDDPRYPNFERAWKSSDIDEHQFVRSIDVGRSPAELIKHFSQTFERYGGPRQGLSITNMESIISAVPVHRDGNVAKAKQITMNLPEGSDARVAFFGVSKTTAEMKGKRSFYRLTFQNGKIQWIDSVGIVRAEVTAEQTGMTAEVEISNNEIVIQINGAAKQNEDESDLVKVEMNLATGAPKDEQQPPHGSVRYEIFDHSDTENKPMRLKMMWRYDLDQLAREAEHQSGKKWDAIIWGVDDPRTHNLRR